MPPSVSATNGRSVSIFVGWVLHSISITARTIGSEIEMVMLVKVDVLVTVMKVEWIVCRYRCTRDEYAAGHHYE